jgi:hypothetical protein
MVAASRAPHPGVLGRMVVLSGPAMNVRDRKLWCAARACVHIDLAIDRLADLADHLELIDEDLIGDLRASMQSLWRVREGLFAIVESYEDGGNDAGQT